MRIAVTGSAGFIGAELVNYFAAASHHVIALQRKPGTDHPNVQYVKFDLTYEDIASGLLIADALVHCAFIRSDKQNKQAFKQNVEGTLRLAELCRNRAIQFIFLSSMSGHSEAVSDYGKHKYELEQILSADKNVCIIKPGLVIGSSGGLYSSIKNIVSKAAFIPMIDGGTQPVQIIHVNDLCRLVEIAIQKRLTGIYNVATPKVYRLHELYRYIATKQNKNPRFVPVPFWFMRIALTTLEILPVTLPVTTENLLGLKQLKAFDTAGDLQKIGIELMEMEKAISIS